MNPILKIIGIVAATVMGLVGFNKLDTQQDIEPNKGNQRALSQAQMQNSNLDAKLKSSEKELAKLQESEAQRNDVKLQDKEFNAGLDDFIKAGSIKERSVNRSIKINTNSKTISSDLRDKVVARDQAKLKIIDYIKNIAGQISNPTELDNANKYLEKVAKAREVTQLTNATDRFFNKAFPAADKADITQIIEGDVDKMRFRSEIELAQQDLRRDIGKSQSWKKEVISATDFGGDNIFASEAVRNMELREVNAAIKFDVAKLEAVNVLGANRNKLNGSKELAAGKEYLHEVVSANNMGDMVAAKDGFAQKAPAEILKTMSGFEKELHDNGQKTALNRSETRVNNSQARVNYSKAEIKYGEAAQHRAEKTSIQEQTRLMDAGDNFANKKTDRDRENGSSANLEHDQRSMKKLVTTALKDVNQQRGHHQKVLSKIESHNYEYKSATGKNPQTLLSDDKLNAEQIRTSRTDKVGLRGDVPEEVIQKWDLKDDKIYDLATENFNLDDDGRLIDKSAVFSVKNEMLKALRDDINDVVYESELKDMTIEIGDIVSANSMDELENLDSFREGYLPAEPVEEKGIGAQLMDSFKSLWGSDSDEPEKEDAPESKSDSHEHSKSHDKNDDVKSYRDLIRGDRTSSFKGAAEEMHSKSDIAKAPEKYTNIVDNSRKNAENNINIS